MLTLFLAHKILRYSRSDKSTKKISVVKQPYIVYDDYRRDSYLALGGILPGTIQSDGLFRYRIENEGVE